MEIGSSMEAYATLHLIEDQKEATRIRKAQLEYCLDTLAMVRIFYIQLARIVRVD